MWAVKPNSCQHLAYFLVVISFVHTHALWAFLGRAGRFNTMLFMVCLTNFMSCRLAPSIAKPIGTPWASVSRLRFTPCLARSVGLGPVFFPSQRRFGHRSIHSQPVPIDPLQIIELFHPGFPQLQKNPGGYPGLKPIMRRGIGTQLGRVQRSPLTPCPQHVENRIGTLPIRVRGFPPPKRWVLRCFGSTGASTAHNSSDTRNPAVTLFTAARCCFLLVCLIKSSIAKSSYPDRLLEF